MTEGFFPTSFGQERLWFLDQLEPGTAAYNLGWAFRIIGSLDQAALVKAFQAVVARHEPLRTVFTSWEGEPKQVVLPEMELEMPTVDLVELPFGERPQAILQLAGEETRRPFDLSRGPLMRVKLVRTGARDQVLVLVMHHIVTDGWSMGLLFLEVAELYRSLTAGREPQLPELSIRYSDFSRWQREFIREESPADQLKYWPPPPPPPEGREASCREPRRYCTYRQTTRVPPAIVGMGEPSVSNSIRGQRKNSRPWLRLSAQLYSWFCLRCSKSCSGATPVRIASSWAHRLPAGMTWNSKN